MLALCIGTVNAVDMPVRQSFAVEMVGREDIGNAVALNSAMFNSARVIGPAVAGLVIGAVGVAAAFVIDAVSFLAVIAALLAMRESELHPAARIERPESFGAVMTQLREGLGYVRTTPVVLIAVLVVGLVGTFGLNFTVIIPPYAEGVLDSDAAGYGFLMAASGVGSLLAALWLAFGNGTRIRRIGYGALILGIGEIALGASRSFPTSLLLMVAVGFGGILMATTANTTMQLAVPGRAAWPGHERLHDGLRGIDPHRRAGHGRARVGLRGGRLARGRRRAVGPRGGRRPRLDAPQRAGPGRAAATRGGSGAGAGCGPSRGRCPERSVAGSRPAPLIMPDRAAGLGPVMLDLAASGHPPP